MKSTVNIFKVLLVLIVNLSCHAKDVKVGFSAQEHFERELKVVGDFVQLHPYVGEGQELAYGLRSWKESQVPQLFFDSVLSEYKNVDVRFIAEFGVRSDPYYYAYMLFVADSTCYVANGGDYFRNSKFGWHLARIDKATFYRSLESIKNQVAFKHQESFFHRGVETSNPKFVFITIPDSTNTSLPFFIYPVHPRYTPQTIADLEFMSDSLLSTRSPDKGTFYKLIDIPLELQSTDSFLVVDSLKANSTAPR